MKASGFRDIGRELLALADVVVLLVVDGVDARFRGGSSVLKQPPMAPDTEKRAGSKNRVQQHVVYLVLLKLVSNLFFVHKPKAE